MSAPHPSVAMSHHLDSNRINTAISTYTGLGFDLFNPDTWVFDLEDIAQALSTTCRFAGHVEFYSVAEHCIRVADKLKEWGWTEEVQLIGLMHDAIEAYIGDIPRPIKKYFTLEGEPITELEQSMEYCMFNAFNLGVFEHYWDEIKKADIAVYEEERDERPNVGQGLQPTAAKRAWLQHWQYLDENRIIHLP